MWSAKKKYSWIWDKANDITKIQTKLNFILVIKHETIKYIIKTKNKIKFYNFNKLQNILFFIMLHVWNHAF